jgi:hypothetical protein
MTIVEVLEIRNRMMRGSPQQEKLKGMVPSERAAVKHPKSRRGTSMRLR